MRWRRVPPIDAASPSAWPRARCASLRDVRADRARVLRRATDVRSSAHRRRGRRRSAPILAHTSTATKRFAQRFASGAPCRITTSPAGPEGEVFPGIAAIALALAALWPRRQTPVSAVKRTPVVPFYAVIGAVALVLSMGADPTVWGVRLPIGMRLSVALRVRAGLQRPSRAGTILDRRASRAGRACERRLCANGLGHAASRAHRRVRGGARNHPARRHGRRHAAGLSRAARPSRSRGVCVGPRRGAGAVLELPAGELDTTFRTYQYEYQTLFHHRPIVNGASGYNSALQVFLGSSASPLVEPDYFPDGLRALRQAGVGAVVVHTQAFTDPSAGASIVELARPASEPVR